MQSNMLDFIAGFDQLCAGAIMSRLAVYKAREIPLDEVLRWVDRHLIRLVCHLFIFFLRLTTQSLSSPLFLLPYSLFDMLGGGGIEGSIGPFSRVSLSFKRTFHSFFFNYCFEFYPSVDALPDVTRRNIRQRICTILPSCS